MIKAEDLYRRLYEIEDLIRRHENPDGTCGFDEEQVMIALDIVKHRLEKTLGSAVQD